MTYRLHTQAAGEAWQVVDTEDTEDRIDLAQRLMVEITIRLEDLAARATRLQRSRTSDPALGADLQAVKDLIEAHGRLVRPRSNRAKSRT